MPKTPMAALILAKLISENIQEIPSTMTELYSKYCELALGRWDMSKGLTSQTEYDTLHKITNMLSQYFMENNLIEIGLNEVREIIDNYLKERNINLEVTKIYNKLINCKEIFIVDETDRKIKFRHRTFMEFNFAQCIKNSYKPEWKISKIIFSSYWSNAFFFYMGLLRDCQDIINEITELEVDTIELKFMKTFTNGTFLLAAYQTPYSIIYSSLKKDFIDAVNLYDTLIENPPKEVMDMSKISIFIIITRLLVNSYSFDFFKQAIEDLILEVDSSINIEENFKNRLIFLLATVLNTIDQTSDSYRFIAKNKNLAAELQFLVSIFHNSNVKEITVDKLIKKFHRNLKSSQQLSSSLKKFVEVPLIVSSGNKA